MRRAICALIACVMLMPLCVTAISSLMSGAELGYVYAPGRAFRWIPYKVTLMNYWELLFASEAYLSTFWNSMFIACASSALQALISLVAGCALARARFWGRGGLCFVYIMVMLTPFQVTLLPNYIMIKQLGLYNTWWALILPNAFAPLGAFLIRQFIREIPGDMIEAAFMDTSSNARVMFRVIAPNIKPGLIAVCVLAFAESWNMVEQPLILLEDQWLYPLSLRLNGLSGAALNLRFSGAVLFLVPAILLYFLFENELVEGVGHMKL